MRIHTLSSLLAVLLWLGAACAANAADADTARVLAAARHAFGSIEYRGTLVATGKEEASGLSGPWRLAQDVATGRTRQTVDFGVYRTADVWDGTTRWRQDHSGGVHALNSAFARQNAATNAWMARYGFLRTDGARIEYLKPEQDGGKTYDVLRATPTGGQPVTLWFDKATGLLARSIWVMPIEIVTVRYDDYRSVDGLMVAFRQVTESDFSSSPDTVTIDRASWIASAAKDEFAAPRTPDDSSVANGVATVPVSYDGDVVIEAMLNGKGPFDFILDTGGHDILTPEAAKALGLKFSGAGTSGGAGEGTMAEQYARVEKVEIGGVTLRDQSFFVDPLQFDTVERGTRPPLAGIMGVELFERFAMELNYHAQTLTFRRLNNAPEGHGIAVPISFTDDQPIFTASIDGIAGDNGLDTGNSGALVVQGRWAQAHGLAARMRRGLLTAGFGAGGMSKNWVVRADVEVAGIKFPHIVASYSEDTKGAFSSRTEAGNIGNQIYQNFTLGFDYARNTVWFDPLPGAPAAPRNYPGAGMSLYKQTADAFTVAVVLPGGPAAKAGIAAGDRIAAVDGTSAAQLSGWDMGRILRRPVGTTLTFDVVHGGQTRKIPIALRTLLP